MQPPWIWLPIVGPIRISTVLAGIVMVVAILWQRRVLSTAVITLMAWASAYEILYQVTGAVVHGWSLTNVVWLGAAVSGWVVLGLVLGIIPDRRLLLLTAVVWVPWIVSGFNSNSPATAGTAGLPNDFNMAGEIFNELTKTLLALAYLVGALKVQPRPKKR
jgi:hypothetical protein